MEIEKGKLELMLEALKKVKESEISDIITKYNILKNEEKLILSGEIEPLKNIHPDKITQEFELKREEKLKELCEKDENGELKLTENNQAVLTDENQKIFNEYLKEITDEYNPKFIKAIEGYNKIASEKVELDLKKIKLSSLPNIDINYLFNIMDLIDEE